MDSREILTRFKDGTLERRHALALLAGARDTPAADTAPSVPPAPAVPALPAGLRALPDSPVPAGGSTLPDAPAGSSRAGWCAVVALQGRWPGAADPDAFWEAELRARGAACQPDDGVDVLDPALFAPDPEEAVRTDHRERLLLSVARQVLESAGYAGARLEALTGPDGERRSVGVFAAGGAARLSRVLDLRGPSQDIGTGPSSFLTALHLALGALRGGECAAALVAAAEPRARAPTPELLNPRPAPHAAAVARHPAPSPPHSSRRPPPRSPPGTSCTPSCRPARWGTREAVPTPRCATGCGAGPCSPPEHRPYKCRWRKTDTDTGTAPGPRERDRRRRPP
ncbi:beta-ketoacyl synthase N-terminal-like domain-containing protein [Streptomyces sp. NPDC058964]|uniref:beta-ketoacyl synthase N-terminal-like domain-containing protein n=1 Tax=Streptomyces sp. NPDC058964 TaxID=3346681 RepID=UPI00369E47DE